MEPVAELADQRSHGLGPALRRGIGRGSVVGTLLGRRLGLGREPTEVRIGGRHERHLLGGDRRAVSRLDAAIRTLRPIEEPSLALLVSESDQIHLEVSELSL